MIIPVRCFSCGKVIGSAWEAFQAKVEEGMSEKEALDSLNITRFCCRSAIISHVETIDTVGAYE